MSSTRTKFITGILLVLLSFLVEMKIRAAFGVAPELVFALLVGYVFFFSTLELVFFIGLGVIFLNWQPAAGIEFTIIAGIPLLLSLVKNILPWQGWLEHLIAIVAGVILLYAVSYSVNIIPISSLIFEDIALSVLWGAVMFYLFSRFYRGRT